tara:strand:+ start:818 stop:1033 length:216 start_codon:yes stop_codon:yes gene_type:complete
MGLICLIDPLSSIAELFVETNEEVIRRYVQNQLKKMDEKEEFNKKLPPSFKLGLLGIKLLIGFCPLIKILL